MTMPGQTVDAGPYRPAGHETAQAPAESQPAGETVLHLDGRVISRILVVTTASVILLGIMREIFFHTVGTGTILQDLRHFGMGEELSLPAWYSSLLMSISALLLAIIAGKAKREGDSWAFHWGVLSLVFLCMSLDETASFHETLMIPIRDLLGVGGYLYYAWVIPGAIGVAILGLYYLPFLLNLPRHFALRFAIAGFIFVGGALGIEMIGGEIDERLGNTHPLWSPVMLVEESCEFIGVTLFVLALIDYLSTRWRGGKVSLQFARA